MGAEISGYKANDNQHTREGKAKSGPLSKVRYLPKVCYCVCGGNGGLTVDAFHIILLPTLRQVLAILVCHQSRPWQRLVENHDLSVVFTKKNHFLFNASDEVTWPVASLMYIPLDIMWSGI